MSTPCPICNNFDDTDKKECCLLWRAVEKRIVELERKVERLSLNVFTPCSACGELKNTVLELDADDHCGKCRESLANVRTGMHPLSGFAVGGACSQCQVARGAYVEDETGRLFCKRCRDDK